MSKIRLGFIGTGFMGQCAHMDHYDALRDQCELVAIAEAREDLRAQVASRYRIPETYASADDLLSYADVDAYVCIQQYRNHLGLLSKVLAKGKPVLTEKPIALSVEAGQQLRDLAKQYGSTYMIANHKRSDPAIEYAKCVIEEFLTSGEYGKPRYFRLTMPPGDWIGGSGNAISSNEKYPPLELEPASLMPYFTPEQAHDYDVFVNYYIHQVNLMHFLMGEDYKVSYADPSGALLIAHSASGVPGTLEMATFNNSVDWQESALVTFEHAYVYITLPAPLASQQAGTVTVMKDAQGSKQPMFEMPMLPKRCAMRNQAMNFLKVCRGEMKPPCSAEDAVFDLTIARDYIQMLSAK